MTESKHPFNSATNVHNILSNVCDDVYVLTFWHPLLP